MKILHTKSIWILSILLFTSCSEFLIKSNGTNFTVDDLDLPTRRISIESYKRDLQLLLYTLDNAYPPALRAEDANYSSLRKRLLEIANLREPLSASQFCREIDDRLADVLDNHLYASIGGGIVCSLKRQKTIGNVGVPTTPENGVWSVREISLGTETVPLITLHHFALHDDPVWNGFLEEVIEAKKTAPAILIDLRGNQGGDSEFADKLTEILYGGQPPEFRNSVEIQTAQAIQLERNLFQSKAALQYLQRGAVPDFLSKRLIEIDEKLENAKAGLLPKSIETNAKKGQEFNAAKGFAKPIVLLQDRGCASSCELLVENLQQHPMAKTIGEHSAGTVHFGNMRSLALRASGITVQIPTKAITFTDGRFVEKVGYKPNLVVAAGDDALEIAKREISLALKKAKKTSPKKLKRYKPAPLGVEK